MTRRPIRLQRIYFPYRPGQTCGVDGCQELAAYCVALAHHHETGWFLEQDMHVPFVCQHHRERNGIDGRYTNICLARGWTEYWPLDAAVPTCRPPRAPTRTQGAGSWPVVRVTAYSRMFDTMLRDELPRSARRHVLGDGTVLYDVKTRKLPRLGPIYWAQGAVLVGRIDLVERASEAAR